MFDDGCPSEMGAAPQVGIAEAATSALAHVRALGRISARFVAHEGRTGPASLLQSGGYRLALPSTFARHAEGLLLNTGGGVAGGDQVDLELGAEAGADVVFSTQGAERVYRSSGAPAVVDVQLRLQPGARLDWLPQQTILYAGARFQRRISVDLAGSSRLVMAEILTFGRPASQERNATTSIVDQWRIRRDGRLVLAEALRLAGDMRALFARPAVGGEACTAATVVHVAPDAPDRLGVARNAITDARCEAGVSAWNGLIAARFLGPRPADVIAATAHLARELTGRGLPRAWAI